jgi:hypothetical protein
VLRERGVRHVADLGRSDVSNETSRDAGIPEDSAEAALATLARVHAGAELKLAVDARVRLAVLLAELLELKARLRAARAAIG